MTSGSMVLEGRFRCDELVKGGGGVDTYLGTDLGRGERVVIKRVAAAEVTDDVRARFEHEAEVLRLLAPVSVGSPVTIGRESEHMYLVQPLVPGTTLAERLRRGPLSVRSTLQVGFHLLQALQWAHDHEVLHRDVKPANVIVDEREPVERAVLIDFGFARSALLAPSLRQERVGTARYLAPEASGLLEREVDERTDLYAVGVVLFECLAGRPPFEGGDVGEVLRQHLNVPAPRLRELGVVLPRALEAVVQRLLRKDPTERYQSAGAALADLVAIAEGVARGIDEPRVVIGLHDRRHTLTEPAFVGRQGELRRLVGLAAQAGKALGGLVLLESASGGGKTRLLDELAHHSCADAWISRGQGVDQTARQPFQLLQGLVRDIVAACTVDHGLADRLRRQVGDHVDAVVAALPDLAATLGVTGAADLGPEAYGEIRSRNALTALLDALGSTGRPALLLLDDCQWADEPTLRLLTHWQSSTSNSGLVVVAAFRSEEVPAHHPLRTVVPLGAVVLEPFDAQDVRSLAGSMAGPLPAQALATISSLSEGSPFMASAVLRGLVECGALVDAPGGWEVDEARLAEVQTSRRAALFLVRRLELLAPETLALLSAGAVLGKEFDVVLAVELCGADVATVAAGFSEACRRQIVWVDEPAGRARFLHDKLREALLHRLEAGHRRMLHHRAAVRLEALDADAPAVERVFSLAYHFDAAGCASQALPYALRAAEVARRRHSLEVAAAHYRMAERAAGGHEATRARVAEGLGDVRTLQGSYDEATSHLDEALSLAATEVQRATLEGKLGDVAFKRGDQRSARIHLERAVRQLGGRLPGGRLGLFVALAVEIIVQAAHSVAPGLFLARRSTQGSERELLAIRLYSRLAYVYWFSAGKVPCAWAHLREMNLAERYPPTAELAQAYSEHAPVMTMAPWFGRGIAYAQRSLQIRRDLGDLWGQGQSLNFYGVALYAASRYRESIERCREAVRLLDQTGDRWEANTAAWNIAFSHHRLGELADAVAVAQSVHAAAVDIGDDTAAGVSLSAWSRASGGKVPADLVGERLQQRNDDAHTATEVHMAEGIRLLGEGRWDEAVAVLRDAHGIVRRAGLRQEYVAPVLPWLATALRSQAEATSPYDARLRRGRVRSARRTARRAGWMARSYRNNAPHALRERGMVAALGGRHRRARRFLARSLAVADDQGARYEHALTRLAWSRTGRALATVPADRVGDDAASDIAAMSPVADQPAEVPGAGVVPSLSLADRFATLMGVGRRIASAASVAAVHDAVREAAFALLRGERCHVIQFDETREPGGTTASGEDVDQLSHSLIRRALAAGSPVVLADDPVEHSADSIVLSGLRSALCAPILSRGRPVACLYVTHNGVAGLFGDDEVQLTEFIVALAGAALEHLSDTEARFQSLAENSSDVVTVVDRNGVITYQSSAVARVFGFEPGEMTQRPLASWLHPDDAGEVLDLLERVCAGSEASQLVDVRLRHRDGSWREVETALNNLLDDPSVQGLVLNCRDVSDRKQAERELLATLQREHEMRERLQELDVIKTDFVSSVSHELRTPLSSILGYVEMLSDDLGGDLAGEQIAMLEVIDRNARRLLALIENLLTISSAESGAFRLSIEPIQVFRLVESAHQAVLPNLAKRDLAVSVEVADDVGSLLGDAGQLDRVVINLLVNAIKFTPDGGRISVRAERQDDVVLLRVRDNGTGIPADEQPRIFERFFRSSSALKLAVQGTGLGLAITKKIIEEHGGEISVVSRLGEGTEFTVCLPGAATGQEADAGRSSAKVMGITVGRKC